MKKIFISILCIVLISLMSVFISANDYTNEDVVINDNMIKQGENYIIHNHKLKMKDNMVKQGDNYIIYNHKLMMKDKNGIQKDYKNVTSFKIKDKKIEIDWHNTKKITLTPFYINDKNKTKSVPSDFETDYDIYNGYYKWTYIMPNIPEMESFGVDIDGNCTLDSKYILVCGEQRLNFIDLIEAGYEIELTDEQLLITNLSACGVDYCVFDPTVEQDYDAVMQDAFTNGDTAFQNTNYGSDAIIYAGSYYGSPDYLRYTFIYINKSMIDTDNFGSWEEVFLHFKTANQNTNAAGYSYDCYNDGFNENTLTWNNQGTEVINAIAGGSTFTNPPVGTYGRINLTACFANSGNDLTVRFSRASTYHFGLYSREAGVNLAGYINGTFADIVCDQTTDCDTGFFCNSTQVCQTKKAQAESCLQADLFNASDSVNLICSGGSCASSVCNGLPTFVGGSIISSTPYNLFLEDENYSCTVTGASDPDSDEYYLAYFYILNGSSMTYHPLRIANGLNSLVAYYPFQSNANDFSGNLHAGNPISATTTQGYIDGAFAFDGIDDYITVPYSTDFNFNKTESFSAFAFLRTNDISNAGYIVGLSGINNLWGLRISGNKLYLRWRNSTAGLETVAISNVLSDTTNYHLLGFTYDGSTSNVSLYVDGILEHSEIKIVDLETNTATLRIGGYTVAQAFNGTIDEVAMWNKSLTPFEVSHLYYGMINKYINLTNKTYLLGYPNTYRDVSAGDNLKCQAQIFDIYGRGSISNSASDLITNYMFSYYDEMTGGVFSFEGVDDFNTRIYCNDQDKVIDISNSNITISKTSAYVGTCSLDSARTTIEFNDSSTYFRVIKPVIGNNDVYLIDLLNYTALEISMMYIDLSGIYANSSLFVYKLIGNSKEIINEAKFSVEQRQTLYLIKNEVYSLEIINLLGQSRVLGDIIPVISGSKVLRLFDVNLYVNQTDFSDHVSAGIIMTNQTGTYEIRSQYNDTGNVLASTTFIVRNRTSTGTVYYNSSSTASNAMFTMPTNASTFNDTFYCEFIYTSNDGNINNYIKVLATADIFTFPHPAKDNFRNPFTFAWIIFFIMFVFALSLNIATADVGTLLLVGFAIFVAKVGWIEIAWAALSIALLIAIFKLLRNEGDR